MWGPNGRFGYLPISNTKAYWYLLINAHPNDPLIAKYNVSDLIERLKNYPQPVTDIIELTENHHILKHDIYDIPAIDQYVFDHIALVGDAAHAMTPNLGQGACQGIEDAYILGLSLSRHPDHGLQEYEKKRLHRANTFVNMSRRVGAMAQLEYPFLCRIRNFMMKMTPQAAYRKQNQFIYDYRYEKRKALSRH
ncbi:FAD-dependent monooxygenase [Paenibacillus chungangensis]|uniref:FAD-dependent monooxygenase n=1 Tax=Paenibacillus chungangensis TaxID=696535 RepID=A0ABW3HUS1_9BACL